MIGYVKVNPVLSNETRFHATDTPLSPQAPNDPLILLSPSDRAEPWGDRLLEQARRARQQAEKRLGVTLDGPVHLITKRNTYEFQRYLDSRPTHVVAVARPHFSEVVIHRPSWIAQNAHEQFQTLVHEMTHLILGRQIRGRLPTWLSEGLAMITAEEVTYSNRWRVVSAGTFGSLLPIERLNYDVLFGGELQRLAYAQSLSMTRFLLQRSFPGSDPRGRDPSELVARLADPRTGRKMLDQLWDPQFQHALEYQWRASQQTVWSWLGVLSGASVFWAFCSALLLLAYWRKRRMSRLKREAFAQQEARDAELGLEPPPWEYEGDLEEWLEEEEEYR